MIISIILLDDIGIIEFLFDNLSEGRGITFETYSPLNMIDASPSYLSSW